MGILSFEQKGITNKGKTLHETTPQKDIYQIFKSCVQLITSDFKGTFKNNVMRRGGGVYSFSVLGVIHKLCNAIRGTLCYARS